MLRISEHYPYYVSNEDHRARLEKAGISCSLDDLAAIGPIFFKGNKEAVCFNVQLDNGLPVIDSSYYIGLDRIGPKQVPLVIEPKLNQGENKLDVLSMLMEALSEPENFAHLDGLMDIRFNDEWIEVEGVENMQLTPFLIIQFLMSVKNLVHKGLKQDYYMVEENLSGRVRGKILVAQQIRKNVVRDRPMNMFCSYQDHGLDTEMNQFIKYVLRFVQARIENYPNVAFKEKMNTLLRYSLGGFRQVSEKRFYNFKRKELNPFYKEYNTAIELGNQILQLMDHNLSKAVSDISKYPPHWIDMSKLFELYVFKKLRERYPRKGQVIYHYKTNYQELDYIIKTPELNAVVDAKYKPRYRSGNPSKEDARQLSGYARLKRVYRELGIGPDQLIPVYFIYPADLLVEGEDNDLELMEEVDLNSTLGIIDGTMRASSSYERMYLQEIKMPCM